MPLLLILSAQKPRNGSVKKHNINSEYLRGQQREDRWKENQAYKALEDKLQEDTTTTKSLATHYKVKYPILALGKISSLPTSGHLSSQL